MEKIEYRTRDKSDWPRGPWIQEPDKVQWADEATGLPCLIVRNSFGALCGYVGVAEGHPLHGKSDEEVCLTAHGGVNYAAPCADSQDEAHGICHLPAPGEPDHVWWFGFDCAHAGDISPAPSYPGHDPLRGLGEPTGWGSVYEYRDVPYVQGQCAELARQLKALA